MDQQREHERVGGLQSSQERELLQIQVRHCVSWILQQPQFAIRAMLVADANMLLPNPQQTLREEKDRAEARQGELLKRHESERKELEAAFDQLQAKFHQLSELAETSKVR